MDQKELYHLLEKYRKNECSSEEIRMIEEWYDRFEGEVDAGFVLDQARSERFWKNFMTKVTIPRRKRLEIFRQAAAVACMLLVVAGLWLYGKSEDVPGKPAEVDKLYPHQGQVTLELSDGSLLRLDATGDIMEGNVLTARNDSSRVLDYSPVPDQPSGTGRLAFNTVRTPMGGEYKVVLSDGTAVHMNACSALRYPVTFDGSVRKVELEGEAFFEVARNGKPFIVRAGNLDIKVLGTSFNVSAYDDDRKATATLVSGRVRLVELESGETMDLEKGMTFVCDRKTGKTHLERDNESLFIAWKDGLFRFEDMRLDDIMTRLQRWYDCEVHFADAASAAMTFTGMAEKYKSVDYLLDMIETVADVRIDINGKNIRVESKKIKRVRS